MANVLTGLKSDLWKAADLVSREWVGHLPSVTINGAVERVAKGVQVKSHFTRQVVAQDRNVAIQTSEGTDQTVDSKQMTITKDRSVEIPWTGEDQMYVNTGAGFATIYGDQVAQAMRTITNEMEADLHAEAVANATRAVGTAGTTPFASSLAVLGDLDKVFVDNGAPQNSGQRSLVIDSTAGSNLFGLTQLTNVNQAGDSSFLRQGIMGNLNGFNMRKTGTPSTHVSGTGSGYLVNNVAGYAVGDTSITLDTGTGTILAGDVITFAGDANQYVVSTALTGGVVVLGGNGLRQALADNTAVTVVPNYAANVAYERSAIELAVRQPARPVFNGVARDSAIDRTTIIDPHSGVPFEISVYVGQGKAMMEVAAAWGVRAWKKENINLLLG